MTSRINTQFVSALIDARIRRTGQWLPESTSKRVLLIVAVVAAGLGLADLLGLGAAIAEAGLPPKTPTGTGPE
jgi:hypothetical protein